MSKRMQFLSVQNIADMVKRFYIAHQNDGGERPLAYFQENVYGLMRDWPQLAYADSYESLVDDPESELDRLNADFYREKIDGFLPKTDYRRLPKLESVDDFLNYDIPREPEGRTVNQQMYRDGNQFRYDQKIPRNFSRDNGGLTGRSLEHVQRGMPGMDRIHTAVDQPYVRGKEPQQREVDDSTSLLIDTSFN